MATNLLIDKKNVVMPAVEYYPAGKNTTLQEKKKCWCNNMDGHQKHGKWKKPEAKEWPHVYEMSRKGKFTESENRSVVFLELKVAVAMKMF